MARKRVVDVRAHERRTATGEIAQVRAHERSIERGTPRMTLSPAGRKVQVPEGAGMYLGRTVEDVGPGGYTNISEIRNTAKRVKADLDAGVIDRRTANARLMRLKGIVEQTKTGPLAKRENKVTAIKEINKVRKAIDPEWKSLSTDPGPERPTPKQTRAAKENIKKAQAERWD